MIDVLREMWQDHIWIYTGIAGALFGAAFLAYFRTTHAGIYCYAKFDQILDWIRDRYGWTWFDQPENAWKKMYPSVANKIEDLEKRIEKLEIRG